MRSSVKMAVLAATATLVPGLNAYAQEVTQTLTVSPATYIANENVTLEIRALLQNSDGTVTSGEIVSWTVSKGPNAGEDLGDCTVNQRNACLINFTGDDGPGIDTIVAFLDKDSDNTPDPDELSSEGTVEWVDVPADVCLDVDPESLSVESGEEALVTASVTTASGTAGDDDCAGEAASKVGLTVSIVDDAPNAFISSLNGQAATQRSNTLTPRTGKSGQVVIGVSLENGLTAGDLVNALAFSVNGVPGSDTDTATDSVASADTVDIVWSDTRAPNISGVSASPTTLSLKKKKSTTLFFSVDEVATATVVVKKKGRTVKTLLKQAPVDAGSHAVEWNGKGKGGKSVKPGRYAIKVTAVDGFGNASTASTTVRIKK